MEQKLRIGLIGFGGMGSKYARMIYQNMVPGMKLTGVCCRNAEGQRVLREEFPGVSIYESTEIMEDREREYDAVLVVTPHISHVPIAMQMAKLGKHILMDKPAGISAGEVEKLVAYCEEKGLAFGMIFHNRCLPAFRKVRKLLADGALGELHRAVWICNDWYRSPAYHRSASWRSSWNGECGGLMINQNPHYLDLWNAMFGLPDTIYADLRFGRYNDFLVDDAADVQFGYQNGFHGTMIAATGEAPGVNRLEIWGSKGCLTVEGASRVFLDENEMSTEEFGRVNQEKFAGIPHTRRELELQPAGDLYQEVMECFARNILEGMPLVADGQDGLREVQLANAIYVSGWESCRVTVPVEDQRYCLGLQKRQEAERMTK